MNPKIIAYFLVFCSIGFVASVAVTKSRCLSGHDAGQLSDADFWKGIGGAEFIKQLDDETYVEFIQDAAKNPKVFVMYYATWCGYAKAARHGFAEAAKNMNESLKFAAVDCEEAPQACGHLYITPPENSEPTDRNQEGQPDIEGYPSFYYFKDGAFNEQYCGGITTKDFTEYLKTKQ